MAGYTILLVDDEAPILKALTRVLQHEGYLLRATTSPTEAVELLRGEEIHLVISDHTMPGMTGLEVLRMARLLRPDTVRVILTGNADLSMALQAINQGEIYRFLTKPWDNNELLLTVRLGLQEYEIRKQNRRLTAVVRQQAETLRRLRGRSGEGAPRAPLPAVAPTGTGVFTISEEELAELEQESGI